MIVSHIRDAYFSLFCFWFRLDLFTQSRENKAIKAFVALVLVEVWLVLGAYWWGEILINLPAPTLSHFMVMVATLVAANYLALRGDGWSDYERRFLTWSPAERGVRMAISAVVSVAAFTMLVTAAMAGRHFDQ